MLSLKIGFVHALALLALSCAQETNDQRKSVGREADVLSRTACQNLRITNGRNSLDHKLNGVVELDIREGRKLHHCTGTFIRSDTILTAAHCFDGLRAAVVEVRLEGKTLAAESYKVNRLYASQSITKKTNNDSAIIHLASNQKVNTIPICDFDPTVSKKALIVGFGGSSNLEHIGHGIKREGVTSIAAINNSGYITSFGQADTTTGSGLDASTSKGDSGGPLLVEDSNNELCIMATTQSGEVIDNNKKIDEAVYTNLRFKDAADFLKQNGIEYNEPRVSYENSSSSRNLLQEGAGRSSDIECN
jgi:secreted trypsin-like serine protease